MTQSSGGDYAAPVSVCHELEALCVDEDKSLLFCFDWKSEDATAAKVLSCVVKKF